MALDTASKRGSALLVGLPFRTLPIPDATIGQGDRQHVALCYAGILATVVSSTIVAWDTIFTATNRDTWFSAVPRDTWFSSHRG